MSKLPAGPWQVKLEAETRFCSRTGAPLSPKEFHWIKDASGLGVALVSGGAANPSEIARLIAEAPSLLAELKNVVAQAETNPFLAVGMLLEHHSNIRAIIARVEGRE